jgi:Domain of unknown function (DUF1902)
MYDTSDYEVSQCWQTTARPSQGPSDWDADARVWYVSETDIPGLATEAASVAAMTRKLRSTASGVGRVTLKQAGLSKHF